MNKLYIDRETLDKIIAAQPEEWELELQQSVLENVMRRQIKAVVPNDVRQLMNQLIKDEVTVAVKQEVGEVVKTWRGTKITLMDEVVAEIRNEVRKITEDAITTGMEYSSKVAKREVDNRLDRIESMVEKVLEEQIRAMVKPALVSEMREAMTKVFTEAIGR